MMPPTRAVCPCSSVPARTGAAPTPREPPSPAAAAPGRPPVCPGRGGGPWDGLCPLCSRPPVPFPAPAPGGCGSARTFRAPAPALSRVGRTSPPTTRGSMTCTGTAATSCPRCGSGGVGRPVQGLSGPPRPHAGCHDGRQKGEAPQISSWGPSPKGSPWAHTYWARGSQALRRAAWRWPPGPRATVGHHRSAPTRAVLGTGPTRVRAAAPWWLCPADVCREQLQRAGRAAQVRPDGQRELPQIGGAQCERRGHGEAPTGTQGSWQDAWARRTLTLAPCLHAPPRS